jgi:hypothetical protein
MLSSIDIQMEAFGYDNVGVARYVILSVLGAGALSALAVTGATTLLPERVARSIDFHKDVLRHG